VRPGPALRGILARHDDPMPVARILSGFLPLSGALSSMGAGDLADMTLPDGRVQAGCQFCSRSYDFLPEAVQGLRRAAASREATAPRRQLNDEGRPPDRPNPELLRPGQE